jgi:16S rRNA (adenine1518-N6/adenine1519-N6)-dimethyltransferase
MKSDTVDYSAQTERINALPPLRATVESADLIAKKKLGQNFLFDLNLTDRIARSAGDLSNSTVLEIGPGPGGLTRALLTNNVKKLIVVEYDWRAIPLQQTLQDIVQDRMHIEQADALKLDDAELVAKAGGELPIKIVANLPYNIGTEMLFKWLDNIEIIDTMTLMFQKEVADRIAAKPNTKSYGILSVLSQFYCESAVMFDINPAAFFPPPKVTSAVVHLKKRDKPIADIDYKTLKTVTKTLFQQRRKTLRQSAKNLWPDSETLLTSANIDPQLRPENLSPIDFCVIAQKLVALQQQEQKQ